MAATKSNRGKRKTTGRGTKKQESTGFQTEIILLIIFAACILIMISNLGMGGLVGTAVSSFCFGAMGLMAYIFPILLFIGAAFLLSNKKNALAYKKIFAGLLFFIFMCGFLQLLTEGYMKSTTLSDYYTLSSDYHTGGGVIGGAICISSTSAFGVIGGYVIIILVLIVTLILVTQRSFFGFMNKIGQGIYSLFKMGQDKYQEGAPERAMKKEIREKERLKRKEEKLRQLEAELAEADLEDEDLELEQELKDGSSSARKKTKTKKAESKATSF